jgi:hypothetical protein
MKNKIIITNALFGLNKQMPVNDFNEFKKELAEVPDQQTQLQIFHNAFMREKTSKIEKYLKTIKNILIIFFIATILGAIIISLQ